MKAIMYHYVREFTDIYPNFRFLDIKKFRKQLSFFDKEYGFVEREEWFEFIARGVMPKRQGKVLLTFDDAMSCHFDYVYPELMDRGLWGIFYVPTKPYRVDEMLDVHKIHCLCGKFNGNDLLEAASRCVKPEMVPDSKKPEFKFMTYKTQNNYEGVTEFKRLLNYYIDYQYRDEILTEIANELNYVFQGSDFYVSWQSLIEMKKQGMVIGSHSDGHPVMSKLSSSQQLDELKISFSVLEQLIDFRFNTYCHPFGGWHDFNSDTVQALDMLNVCFSFMVDPRDITSADINFSRQNLPRYDCNKFRHGEAS